MEWCADWLCLVLGTRLSTPVNSRLNNKYRSTSKAPKTQTTHKNFTKHKIKNDLTLYRNMLTFVVDQISAIDPKLVIQVWTEDSVQYVVILIHNLAKLAQILPILNYPKHILLCLDDVDV